VAATAAKRRRWGWPQRQPVQERADPAVSLEEYIYQLNQFTYQGVTYTAAGDPQEEIGDHFEEMVRLAYKQNSVIFACVVARMLLFSEARFQFQRLRKGRPGELYGNETLGVLETPWPNGTEGDLLASMEVYNSLAGNWFGVRRPGPRLKVLRPDWVDIVIGQGGAWDVDSEVVGYAYTPGGRYSGNPPVHFDVSEVAHWAPFKDPAAEYRGMSWISAIIKEVMADKAATQHKLKFFENGATPNLIIKTSVADLAKFDAWVDSFREKYEGSANAYRTMFLGAGQDPMVVGANLQDVEFKATQGAGETRIAAAARIPPIIVGLSEGLQAATYSNYGQARRAFADSTMRPLWRTACGALAPVVGVPTDSRLWYDDRDIQFLKDDQKDAAEIFARKSSAIKTLVDAGFEPDTAVEAADSLDLTRLTHTGLTSVQLQADQLTQPEPAASQDSAGQNGNVPAPTGG
jgi:phage portal protein BeeE